MVEYALLIGLISVAAILVIIVVGDKLFNYYNWINLEIGGALDSTSSSGC